MVDEVLRVEAPQGSGSVSVPESQGEEVSFWFWVVSCSVLLAFCASVDLLLGGEGRSAPALFWTYALGATAGLLHGAFLGGAFWLLRRRHRFVQVVFWSLFVTGAVLWPVLELDVVTHLGDEYKNLALLALAGFATVGLIASCILVLLQPTGGRARGWMGARRKPVRLSASAGLLLMAGVAIVLDRNFYEGGYSIAHLFLEVGGLWCFFFGTSLLTDRAVQVSQRRGALVLVGTLGLFAVTLFTLTPARERELNVMLERPFAALSLETARGLFDVDFDRYSGVLGGGDCQPFSSQVNPGRAEIPGNGLDDNCRLGDAPDLLDSPTDVEWPTEESQTSVVLITVDTLSAPYMSLYGGKEKTSPGIDAWARRAAVFDRAYTSGGWTSLAISSMMRGLYPRHLKWTRLFETTQWRLLTEDQLRSRRKGEKVKLMFGLPLDDPRMTIPMWLSQRGMATGAVVNDGKSEFLDPLYQKPGFDLFVDMDARAKGRPATDREVTRVAKEVLSQLEKKAPFFLWVHYFGPHLPNTESPQVPRFGSDGVGRYEHEIAALDREVSSLLKRLDALGKKRNLAVILTSDHGEVISSTGRGHGRTVLESSIHIPLVIKAKGFTPGRYETPVSLVDIAPTIYALTKSPIPTHLDGIDVARVVTGDPELTSRVLISETWRYDRYGRLTAESIAALDGDRKLTIDMRTQARALRDQTFPEDERQNLLDGRAENIDLLEQALERHLEAGGSATFVR